MNMDPQAAAEVYRQAGKAEREAMRVGLAQELQRRIRKGSIDGSARNLASTLVGSEQNKQIFRSVLGKDADKFIEELSGVNRAVKNYGIVKGGSDTAENLMLGSQSINFLKHPVEGAVNLAGRGLDWLTGLNQEQVAHMLIDPGYAAVMRAKAGALPPSAYIDISGAGGAFANIAGPKTTAEKNITRKMLEDKLLTTVRGTSVKNRYAQGGQIPFVKAGINKAINSSADSNKLDLLEYAPEIAQAGRPIGSVNRDVFGNEYRYFMTPVKKGDRYNGAVTTTKAGNFYNVNPADFYVKKASAFAPRHKLGNAEVTNSIPNKQPKNKTGKNALTLRDLIILLSRPFALGAEGNIAKQNLQEGN